MSRTESIAFSKNDTPMGLYANYISHMDYSPGDFLLKIITNSGNKVGRKYNLGSFLDSVRSAASAKGLESGFVPDPGGGDDPPPIEDTTVAIVDGINNEDGSPTRFESISEIFAQGIQVKGLNSEDNEVMVQPKTISLFKDVVIEKIILGKTNELPPQLDTLVVQTNGYMLSVIIDPRLEASYHLEVTTINGVSYYRVMRNSYNGGGTSNIVNFWINDRWVPHIWLGTFAAAMSTRDSDPSVSEYVPEEKVARFLDLLLVKTSDFIYQYIEWLRMLNKLERQVNDVESFQSLGVPAKLHPGYIVFSASADTERKIKEDFGGVKWRRIVNFPMIVADSMSHTLKQRGGESFVSLVSENIPDHYHTIKYSKDATKVGEEDVWKSAKAPGSSDPRVNYVTGSDPGLVLGRKTVYPEAAPLNWNEDCANPADLTREPNRWFKTGASRYVVPHFNLPPYKDVYIWECVQAKETTSTARVVFPEEDEGQLNLADGAIQRADNISFNQIGSANPQNDNSNWNISNLSGWGGLDTLCTLISDELLGEEQVRYDTKDAKMQGITDLASWYVWCDKYHIERRYLFRDVYRYLVADIQDRIYFLMKRISSFSMGTYKERLHKGQYVFFYNKAFSTLTDSSISKIFNNYYVLPSGCSYKLVSNVFLRGTSMFTQETKGLFNTYCGLDKSSKSVIYNTIKVSGGLKNVDLYSENFPKHLHWSTLMKGMESCMASKPGSKSKTGGYGSVITMNDPRSGGVKYCNSCGTGPYGFSIGDAGANTPIKHNNMPQLVLMKVYMIW